MSKKSKWRERGKAVRAEGIALTIPMVMITFPIGAGFIGKYLAGHFEMPWILPVCILLGFIAGVVECIKLVKELNRSTD